MLDALSRKIENLKSEIVIMFLGRKLLQLRQYSEIF